MGKQTVVSFSRITRKGLLNSETQLSDMVGMFVWLLDTSQWDFNRINM